MHSTVSERERERERGLSRLLSSHYRKKKLYSLKPTAAASSRFYPHSAAAVKRCSKWPPFRSGIAHAHGDALVSILEMNHIVNHNVVQRGHKMHFEKTADSCKNERQAREGVERERGRG